MNKRRRYKAKRRRAMRKVCGPATYLFWLAARADQTSHADLLAAFDHVWDIWAKGSGMPIG